MTEVPESHRHLLDAPFATLATNGVDGRPQVSAIWFLHDEGRFELSLHARRQKVSNMKRDPVATLFILDLQNPLRYLEVRSDVTIVDDADYAFAHRLGAKYGGTDLRAVDGDDRRRLRVTLVPTHVVAADLSAGG